MGDRVNLASMRSVELTPSPPFHFDATLHKPDHFPSPDNAWEPGVRWQTMLWQDELLGLVFENEGTIDEPRVRLSIWSQDELSDEFVESTVGEIRYRYNLQMDLREFTERYAAHPQLGPIVQRWRGMRPLSYSSLYEYLIIAIVLQNATVRRSVSMMQALLANYGTLLSYGGRELYCFWAPETMDQVSEQELRDLKIGYRAKSIKRVSEAFTRKQIDEHALRGRPKDEQRSALLALYGIGPASVGYLLFDVFRHLDELDTISPWEQRIYSKLFFDASPEEPLPVASLIHYFEQQYGAYKMLAVHYFWEDLFWKRGYEHIEWLEKLIRL
jgi:3-methyladenine DNA glycosylase/8-oxoguanine DNA glycosylase